MFRPTLDPVSLLLISITRLSLSVAKLSNLFIYQLKYRIQSATPVTSDWFALIPFRSPLLWESRLISLPEGTEMFHFPSFAPLRVTDITISWVAPFGNPRIKALWQLPEAYRSLIRPSSPLPAKASTYGP